MFAFLKSERGKDPKPIAKITEAELKNILEQERIVADATKVQVMLSATLMGTKQKLVEIYSLPSVFELDRETGEIFDKEPSNG